MLPPFRVRSYGCVNYDPFHFSPGTKDGDIMLILNVDGYGVFQNAKHKVDIKPLMVLLIEPEFPGVIYSDRDRPYLHYYCRFSGDYAEVLVKELIAQRGSPFFEVASMENLVSCMKQLKFKIRKDLPERMGEYELGLSRLLISLQQNRFENSKAKLTHHDLHQYIVSNIGQLNDLEKMAHHFKMSKPALCRSAKLLLGDTIVNASNKIRIDYACELLQMNAMNVAEVARRVGFEDQFYFSKVFKKLMGVSPKQWKE